MKTVITGGTGFLGQHLGRAFHAAGIEAELWGREKADLLIPTSTLRVFQQAKPELVVHAAATCGGIGANRRSPGVFWYENLQMGINVLQACLSTGVRRVVLVGTTCSYPSETPVPFNETRIWDGYPEPTNAPYGLAKRALMDGYLAFARQFGIEVVIAVPTNLYGPGDNFDPEDSHVIPALIRKIDDKVRHKKKADLVIWGTGKPTRDFLYVQDGAEGIVQLALKAPAGSIVNLGSGEEISIRKLVDVIANVMEVRFPGHFDDTQPDGQMRRCLDTKRAQHLLGWRAKMDLHEGLRRTVEWYREQKEVRL